MDGINTTTEDELDQRWTLKAPTEDEFDRGWVPMDDELDRGWAWIVLISTFFSLILNSLLTYNAGIITISLLEEFGENVATTSLLGSVFLCLFNLMSPVVSVVINRYSCRTAHVIGGLLAFIGYSSSFFIQRLEILLLTYSILAGTGFCFCYTVTLVVLSFNFKRYLGICIGVTMAGAGCGLFISGPFTQYIVEAYGLHGAFLVMGSLSLNEIVFGLLMRPTLTEQFYRKQHQNQQKIRNTGCLRRFKIELFKNKTFIFLLICAFTWSLPHAIMVLHLPNFAVLQGSSAENAAMLITVMGIASVIGRFLSGLSVGPNGIDPLMLFMGICGILGILTLIFPMYSETYVGKLIYSFLFGLYTGGINAIRNPLCLEVVGLQQLSTALGLFCFLESPGFLVGPTLAGYIVDTTGSYEYSIYLTGMFFLVTSLLSLVSSAWKKEIQPEMKLTTETTVFEVTVEDVPI